MSRLLDQLETRSWRLQSGFQGQGIRCWPYFDIGRPFLWRKSKIAAKIWVLVQKLGQSIGAWGNDKVFSLINIIVFIDWLPYSFLILYVNKTSFNGRKSINLMIHPRCNLDPTRLFGKNRPDQTFFSPSYAWYLPISTRLPHYSGTIHLKNHCNTSIVTDF